MSAEHPVKLFACDVRLLLFSALAAREIQFSCSHALDQTMRARFNGLRRCDNAKPRSTERLYTFVPSSSDKRAKLRFARLWIQHRRMKRAFATVCSRSVLGRVLCTKIWPGALTCVYLRDCLLRLCARVVCWLTALRAVNATRFTASNWVMCLSHISWPPARRDGLTSYNRLSPPRIGFFTVRQRRSRTPLPLYDTLDASRCVASCYACVCWTGTFVGLCVQVVHFVSMVRR